MKYLKTFKQLNESINESKVEDATMYEQDTKEYEDKIFIEQGPSKILISVSALQEYLERYFSLNLENVEDLKLEEPEPNRYYLQMELSPIRESKISYDTWEKLHDGFIDFLLVEDTSQNVDYNRFTIDLEGGKDYDIGELPQKRGADRVESAHQKKPTYWDKRISGAPRH